MRLRNTYLRMSAALAQRRALRRQLRWLALLCLVAVLAPWLSNDKPLACKYRGQWLFPAFSTKHTIQAGDTTLDYQMGKDWKLLHAELIIFPPCAWSPGTLDTENAPRCSPFGKQVFTGPDAITRAMPPAYRHWLGTTQNGQDVLAILVHGCAIAMGVGIGGMMIAALVGILLGAFAGYFGNHRLSLGPLQIMALICGIFLTYFYGFVIRGDQLFRAFQEGGIWLVLRLLFLCYVAIKTIGGMVWIAAYLEKKLKLQWSVRFPADIIVSRLIELFNSVPALLLIMALSAIARPSYSLLVIIIGFLGWTGIARVTRAEYLKAANLEYVLAGMALGLKNRRILFRHILPNVLPLVLVQIVFGMGSAVLAEASLSFLGIGVPPGASSWGSLLNEGRDHFSSWWLVLFPGACLGGLMLLYHRIAGELEKGREQRERPQDKA